MCLISGIILGLKLINGNIFLSLSHREEVFRRRCFNNVLHLMMHMVLPLVLKINDWNPAKAKKAVLVGMIIPALAYVGWMMLIFSLVSRQEFLHLDTIGDIMHYALNRPEFPQQFQP